MPATFGIVGGLYRGHGPLLRRETFIIRCSRPRRWRLEIVGRVSGCIA